MTAGHAARHVASRRDAQLLKAERLADTALTMMTQAGLRPDDPLDVAYLAGFLASAPDAQWADLASRAGLRPPGSSYDPAVDRPAEKTRTRDFTVERLRRHANTLRLLEGASR